MLQQWIDALKNYNKSRLTVGELAYNSLHTADFSFNDLREALKPHGVSLPEKATLSKYATVYEFWVKRLDKPKEQLDGVGMSKLYEIANAYKDRADMQPEVYDEWLEKAVKLTRDELKEDLYQQPLVSRFKAFQIEESVATAFDDGLHRLERITGETVSRTKGLEFCAALLNQGSDEWLRDAFKAVSE